MRRVAIVCLTAPGPSHTYIQSHLQHLSPSTALIYGVPPMVDQRPALGRLRRFNFRVRRALLGEAADAPQQRAAYVQALRRVRADVVLAEFGNVGVRVMSACAQLSIPLVVHFHGRDASQFDLLDAYGHTAYPRLFEYASAVIAVSNEMMEVLRRFGCPPHKLHYIPCGADSAYFHGASPAAAAPVFVAVGRLIEKKGPLATIAAFKQVASARSDARLRIVGDGDLRSACEQLIRQLRLESAVTLLGAQPPAVVRAELQQARGFVQHSLRAQNGDSEGTPVSVLEAGACGLPVIATRHAGILDVVLDGETGVLVEEGDVLGMARAMLRLAHEPEFAARLGQAGRRRVSQEFSRARSVARLAAVIERAADSAS